MAHDPVAELARQHLPPDTGTLRRDTDVHIDASDVGDEQISDAIRAAGFKLAAALPDAEEAHRLVRTLSVSELALKLPDWAGQVTRGRSTWQQDPNHLLRQVCAELEGPVEHLERKTRDREHGEAELEGLRFADDVTLATRQLRRLTNDLLDLASIVGGEFEPATLRFQPRDCVAMALAEVRDMARERGCQLLIEVDPGVPGCLIGDPGRLRQVVATLVGNAVSRSKDDEIRVAVHAEVEAKRGVLLHGVISRAEGANATGLRRRLRESGPVLWRGDARTGLGLAISRQLVVQMGGRTWVESPPSGGSLLHFTIRCRRATSRLARATGDLRRRNLQIVLAAAPGEPINTIVKRLRTLNATVTLVHHPDEAARILDQAAGTFDAVVLVASLTSRRGGALAERLGILRHVPPIMLVTRKGHRGDATRCRALGIDAYLPQPVSRRDLEDVLDALTAPPTASAASTPPSEHRRGLITRHMLRETQRRLVLRVVGDAPDVTAMLIELGHHVVDSGMPSERPPDILVVDVSAGDREPVEVISEALVKVGGSPCVLALVSDPGATNLGANPRLGTLSRCHDEVALEEALRRLRDTTQDAAPSAQSGDGPAVWPAVVARTDGDEALALTLIRAFVAHAPNWIAEIERSVHGEGGATAHVAYRQLRTSLAALRLHGTAQLCGDLESAHRANQSDHSERLLRELSRQLNGAIGRIRTILDGRRYVGQRGDKVV